MNPRRDFLARALAGGLALIGFGRRAWASRLGRQADPLFAASEPTRYAPLSRPVRIPVDAVAMPWRPFPFVAEAFAPTPPSGQRRVLINGVVFRRDADVSALCVTCPHEQCQVDFVADAADLARIDGAPPHPVFECGCHASVFDAAKDGARISGETPRGLYRFQIEGITGGMVNITAIEEVALSEV